MEDNLRLKDEPQQESSHDSESSPERSTACVPVWWSGHYPDDGIGSLNDLRHWIDHRLNLFILGREWSPESLHWLEDGLGRQTIINAIRFLTRFGDGDHPRWTNNDLRTHAEIESALNELTTYLRLKTDCGSPKSATTAPLIESNKLSPCHLAAYGQYSRAIREMPELANAPDVKVHEYLAENLDEDERLSAFETWGRYLRVARKACSEQKNSPLAGRELGKSIIRHDQI